MEEEKQFTNRLSKEKSPYLLQHAHNPVDWYPWGKEAFVAAERYNKPIFLSIGYATCHWCHVMEQESFKDPEVAAVLNNAFICIKIDREELPEVDNLYMELAQAIIWGTAGWPLNLILTPELKPFFASTYLPKRSTRGVVGIIELTEKIHELWNGEERQRLVLQADHIMGVLKSQVHTHGDELPKEGLLGQTAEILFKIADSVWGGMRGAPKFPLGYQANFLLRYFARSNDARALFLVEKTQEMMHRGGIYDHLGGGFHRYSTDEYWRVPHFEKMLYDNAILAFAYLETWKVTRRPFYKEVCLQILRYVARDMRHEEGGFYSAEDADSDGIEGLFYTWTRSEVLSILGKDEGELFCEFYGVFDPGIVEGRNVLYETSSLEEFAEKMNHPVDELKERFQLAKMKLFRERTERLTPFKDDKVLTSWNGLMIHAFAQAGFYFQDKNLQEIAVQAAHFICKALMHEGLLMRRYRDGEVRFPAGFDDYACMIYAFLSLFETGMGKEWLVKAEEFALFAKEHFKAPDGAFFQVSKDDTEMLVHKCRFSDGAEPSGNAIHAENLLRLWQITGKEDYLRQAEDIFRAVRYFVDTYPLGYCYHLIALLRYFDPKKALCVIAFNKENEWKEEIVEMLTKATSFHICFMFLDEPTPEHPVIEGKTTMYLCYDGVCKAPLYDKQAILEQIKKL
jgi:uncharacterized protein YyaL (SSP411 family)